MQLSIYETLKKIVSLQQNSFPVFTLISKGRPCLSFLYKDTETTVPHHRRVCDMEKVSQMSFMLLQFTTVVIEQVTTTSSLTGDGMFCMQY